NFNLDSDEHTILLLFSAGFFIPLNKIQFENPAFVKNKSPGTDDPNRAI
ncbi:MAG: hypothetical protein H7Y00_03585, partial [Fimbriimonadaceae bacterium]|nr:hypothetical protein [Chitinophagales bacterium]